MWRAVMDGFLLIAATDLIVNLDVKCHDLLTSFCFYLLCESCWVAGYMSLIESLFTLLFVTWRCSCGPRSWKSCRGGCWAGPEDSDYQLSSGCCSWVIEFLFVVFVAPVSLKVRGTLESCSSTECTHLLLLEQGVNFILFFGCSCCNIEKLLCR